MEQNELLELCGMPALPYSLRDEQKEVIEMISRGDGVLVCWPTGMGKTTTALAAAGYAKTQGKKSILIVPLKSLTAEHLETFSQYFNVVTAYGDDRKTTNFFRSEEFLNADVLVTTFDTLSSAMSSNARRELIMPHIGALIVDEIHSMGIAGRGYRLEDVLTQKLGLWPEINIYGLSATLGNPEEFADWLGVELHYVHPRKRPVPLDKIYWSYEKQYYDFMINDRHIPNSRENMRIRMEYVEQVMRKHIRENPDCRFIIFTTSQPRTIQVANEILSRVYNNRRRYSANDAIRMIDETPVGFHNAGLGKDERKAIEDAYRNGQFNVVVSTPTLAQGVNLPADVCIIFDIEFYDALEGFYLIDENSLQQTIGRAGRPGLSDRGYAYIISHNDRYSEYPNVPAEVKRRAEIPLEIRSQLVKRLAETICRWIAGGNAANKLDINELCANAFESISKRQVNSALKWLLDWDFIKVKDFEDESFECTWFGLQVARQYLAPETIVEWRTQNCCVQDKGNWREVFTRFASVEEYAHIAVIRAGDEELTEIAREELTGRFPFEKECNMRCLTCAKRENSPDRYLEMLENNGRTALPPCEMATTALKTDCSDLELRANRAIDERVLKIFALTFADDLIEKYDLYKKNRDGSYKLNRAGNKEPTIFLSKGDRGRVKEQAERMFRAAKVIFGSNADLANTLSDLEIMGSAGSMNRERALLQRVKGIGSVSAQKLLDAGIKTIGEFISAEDNTLMRILRKAKRIVQGLKQNARKIFESNN